MAPAFAADSATVLFAVNLAANAVWVSPSHHLHSLKKQWQIPSKKEAIKVDFIRWVLIFKN
jgi:hypothetical protein